VEILASTGMKKQYKKEEMSKETEKFYKENPFTIIVICIILMFIFFGMMIMIASSPSI